MLVEAEADDVGDIDGPPDDEDGGGDGDPICAKVGAAGRTAIVPVDEAATTAAASATSPATATIGTTATRLPSDRSSRQFGQKPETGVVT